MKQLLLSVIFWNIEVLVRIAEWIDWDFSHEVFRKFSIIVLMKSGDLVEEE